MEDRASYRKFLLPGLLLLPAIVLLAFSVMIDDESGLGLTFGLILYGLPAIASVVLLLLGAARYTASRRGAQSGVERALFRSNRYVDIATKTLLLGACVVLLGWILVIFGNLQMWW